MSMSIERRPMNDGFPVPAFPLTPGAAAVKTVFTAHLAATLFFSMTAVSAELPSQEAIPALPSAPAWNDQQGFEIETLPVSLISHNGLFDYVHTPIRTDRTFSADTALIMDLDYDLQKPYYVLPDNNVDLTFTDQTLRFNIDNNGRRKLQGLLKTNNHTVNIVGDNLEILYHGSHSRNAISVDIKEVTPENAPTPEDIVIPAGSLNIETNNAWIEMAGDSLTRALVEVEGDFSANIGNNLTFRLTLPESWEQTSVISGKSGLATVSLNAKNLFVSLEKTPTYGILTTGIDMIGQSLRIGKPGSDATMTSDTVDMDNFVIIGPDNGLILDSSVAQLQDKSLQTDIAAKHIYLQGNETEDSVGLSMKNAQKVTVESESLQIAGYQQAIIASGPAELDLDTQTLFLTGNIETYDRSRFAITASQAARLEGDLLAGTASTMAFDLGLAEWIGSADFYSDILGNAPGQIHLSMADNSLWQLTDKSHVSSLAVGASVVNLTHTATGEMPVLTIDAMKGTGTTFILKTDADTPALSVIATGAESEVGTHYLQLETDSRKAKAFADSVAGTDLKIPVVRDASANLIFETKETVTGQGLWTEKILLESETNAEAGQDWFVTGLQSTPGPTAEAFTAGFHNNYLYWRSSLDTTRERFGDLRHDREPGAWGRITAGSLDNDILRNRYQIYRLGADMPLNNICTVGVALERFEGKIDTLYGRGDMGATAGTLYGLAVFENLAYLDAGLRYGRMDYDYENFSILPDTYDYDGNAFGAWAEIGREWTWREHWSLTPHASLAYGRFNTEDIRSANGLRATVDDVTSLVLRAGSDFGYRTGKLSANFTADLLRETEGKQTITLGNDLEHITEIVNYSDTWAEFGFGLAFEPNDHSLVWVNVKASAWADLEEEWRLNAGARIAF